MPLRDPDYSREPAKVTVFERAKKSLGWREIAYGSLGLVAFYTACVFAGGFKTITSPDVGVVRTFGKVSPQTLPPGLHYIWPWQKLEDVNMAFTDLNFVDDKTDQGSITGLSSDGIQIEVPLSVTWAIDPTTVALVKSRLPDYYTDREVVIVRSAVRDAISRFSVANGGIENREALAQAVADSIKARTVYYYQQQGFGAASSHIVDYGAITLRGVFPPDDVVGANDHLVANRIEALAQAARTTIPTGRSVEDYTRVIQAQAVGEAAKNGNITVVTGSQPVSVVAGHK